jgi:transposase IS66 family protein/transposase IS66-like protein
MSDINSLPVFRRRTIGRESECLPTRRCKSRRPGHPIFELAELGKSPLAVEAVRRIDAIFTIEREINGATAEQRLALRQERVKPLLSEFEGWMRAERARLSRHADLARAIDYMLKRWPAFTRFLDDGRICLSNNAAERALRGIALGRRAWLFAGSDRGGERAAAIYTLIATAKLNGVDPQAWLADVLRHIADHPAAHLHELLPWHWKLRQTRAAAPDKPTIAAFAGCLLYTRGRAEKPAPPGADSQSAWVMTVDHMYSSALQIATAALTRLGLRPLDKSGCRSEFTCAPEEFAGWIAQNRDSAPSDDV